MSRAAIRYAKAILETALSSGKENQVNDDMKSIIKVNKDINIKNLFVFLSFLVASTSIIPFNINNSLDKIKKEKKFENVMDNSYSLM